MYWIPPAGREMPMIPAAGRIPGVPPIEDVIARYGERSGRDRSELNYYVAFGHWRLAVTLEGVYTRFFAGAYGQTDGSHEAFGQIVQIVVDLLDLVAAKAGSRRAERAAGRRPRVPAELSARILERRRSGRGWRGTRSSRLRWSSACSGAGRAGMGWTLRGS